VQFELKPIYTPTLAGPSTDTKQAFMEKLSAAERRSSAINASLEAMTTTMKTIRSAIDVTPGDIAALETQYAAVQNEIHAINNELNGLESRNQLGVKPANINSRLGFAGTASWSSYGPTAQHQEQFGYAIAGLNEISTRVKTLQESALPSLQQAVIDAGGPWTPGARGID
jgi:chromosome segregation ATPase